MQLQKLYEEVIKEGIAQDIRSPKAIAQLLKSKNEEYARLSQKEKESFDRQALYNPFADTRILNGNPVSQVKTMIVGIDVDASELVLVDRLNEKGKNIDIVISHHPQGLAYANFYDVMDLQIDAYAKEGISISFAEGALSERKASVERKVHAANHQRSVDVAKLLDINFLCMHTPADNCAYQYIKKLMEKEGPNNLGKALDVLYTVPEYKDAAKNNNPPKIVLGTKHSRVSKIHIEFTGGTEGPESAYAKLASLGIDTVISMHQSEEHFKKCKEANINVIFASHIASDNLGMNIMFDHLENKEKFKIYEFSGFRRFKHKNG